MAFSIESSRLGDTLLVHVSGKIDEDSNFSGCASVILELENISAINSVGVREWIRWIKGFPSTLKLVVRKCPKIIVDQINMVSGFLPAGTVVESFYVPFFADISGEEKMVLFSIGKEYRGGDVFAPKQISDTTGAPMEMDVIEAKYFKFLKNV
jgi:hypothetical protein